MRKALVLFAVLLVVSLPGCVCKAERKGVEEIEKTMILEDAEYLKYIEADTKLDAAQKDDRKKLIESRKRLTEQLKKSME